MINISGYVSDIDEDIVDNTNYIAVNSCGYYKLKNTPVYKTIRPVGRSDFQALYVAKGVAYFYINDEIVKVPEGGLFVYQPNIPQHYEYKLSDSPEIYWLHFSGANACEYLTNLDLINSPYSNVGCNLEYVSIFDKIIRELQVKRKNFFTLSNLYALELFSLMSRNMSEASLNIHVRNENIQKIIQLINKDFGDSQSVSEYAQLCNMSTCWFIKCFKEYTHFTPQQYITDIRIKKAKELLASSSFNITEISSIVGYENPFYFSRIFKKTTKLSPREYLKSLKNTT